MNTGISRMIGKDARRSNPTQNPERRRRSAKLVERAADRREFALAVNGR
jgi:hypothetical protein